MDIKDRVERFWQNNNTEEKGRQAENDIVKREQEKNIQNGTFK